MNLSKSVPAVIVAVLVTLFVWAFPVTAVLSQITSWAHSLWVALVLLVFVLLPLYMWGIYALLGKLMYVRLNTLRAKVLLAALLVVLCLFLPYSLLNSFYGFGLPVSSDSYRFDACVLENGVGGYDDITPL